MKKSCFGADGSDVFSKAYTGAADFGRGYAYVVSAFVFVLCAVGVAIGIYLIRRKPVYTEQVDFLVTKVTPEIKTEMQTNYDNYTRTRTTIPVTKTVYNLEGKVQSCGDKVVSLPGYPNYIIVGQVTKAWMKPECSSTEAHYSSDDTKVIGYAVLGISSAVVIFNILRIYLVRKYKGVAAVQGAAGVTNIFDILRR